MFIKATSPIVKAASPPGVHSIDVMKTTAAKWMALSAEEKAVWNNKSKQQQ